MKVEREEVFVVVAQAWEESERGWGTRPDGHSLHLSMEERDRYIEAYWGSMPSAVPDEYSRPVGMPRRVFVDAAELAELKRCGGSLRRY